MNSRTLKNKIVPLLLEKNPERGIRAICSYPLRKVINPLFSLFCSNNPLLKWRAVTATGAVVSSLAETSMEDARIIMRRLMWLLNDESGGIGWGAPEAMGEIMAVNKSLADEYNRILISYASEEGNFLEHEILQRGLLWGLGRVAEIRPAHVKAAAEPVKRHLHSKDPEKRGLAAWFLGNIGDMTSQEQLSELEQDHSTFNFYHNGFIQKISVSEMVALATTRAQNSASGGSVDGHTFTLFCMIGG